MNQITIITICFNNLEDVISTCKSVDIQDKKPFEHLVIEGRQPNHQKIASQWVNKSKVAWRYLPFIYYISTMVSWSFEYLRKTKGHWGTYFTAWGKVLQIVFSEKRNTIDRKGIAYLKKVKARLWY